VPHGRSSSRAQEVCDALGHLDRALRPLRVAAGSGTARRRPLDEILVVGSTFSRNHLKERLYQAGLKPPVCEMCGQGEVWRGATMAMILDHINGVANDHRIENLRIVCPNCAATLDTHCARGRRISRADQSCLRCGASFRPKSATQRYCSRECALAGIDQASLDPALAESIVRPIHS
jgi:hypothetical protein